MKKNIVSLSYNSDKSFLLLSTFIFLLFVIILYSNSIHNEFTNWDDDALIVNNSSIRSLNIENLVKIFTWHKGNTYQPIRVLSYAIDYHFWKLNPVAYHIHSILLHFLATIFLFLTLYRILPQISEQNQIILRYISLITALFFLIHPINVEAVTWLSSRKYVLLSFFSFSSFFCFIKILENNVFNLYYFILSLILCVCAILSSPFGVVLPALFFLFEYCRDKSLNPFKVLKKRLILFWPYIIVSFVLSSMIFISLAGQGGGARTFHYQGDIIYTFYSIFYSLFNYMINFLLPLWLNNRYVDYIFFSVIDVYKIPTAFIILILALIFVFMQLRKGSKIFLFCVGWFLIMWIPSSNIIPISTKMADRYVYMASPGVFLQFTYGAYYLYLWTNKFFIKIYQGKKDFVIIKIFALSITLFLILILSILNIQRNKIWRNSGTLWQDSIKKDPKNFLAHNNLGLYLFSQGDVDNAIYHLKRSIILKPDMVDSFTNLGIIFYRLGSFDKAYQCYMTGLEHNKGDLELNLALSYMLVKYNRLKEATPYINYLCDMDYKPDNPLLLNQMGNIFIMLDQNEKAVSYYSEALKKFPDNADLYYNRGIALSKLGKTADAILAYKKAITLDPSHNDSYNNLGRIMEQKGDLDNALKYYDEAVRIDSDFAEAYNNMGNIFFAKGDIETAKINYMRTIELKDDYVDAHYNFALVLAHYHSFDKATMQYQKVLKLDPNHDKAYNNLGNIFIRQKKFDEAIDCFKKGLIKNPENDKFYYNMAVAFQEKGDLKNAILNFQKVLSMTPEDVELYNRIGMLMTYNSDFEAAIEYFKTLINIKPDYVKAYFNLGIVLTKLGKTEEAIQYFEKVRQLECDDENVLKIIRYILQK